MIILDCVSLLLRVVVGTHRIDHLSHIVAWSATTGRAHVLLGHVHVPLSISTAGDVYLVGQGHIGWVRIGEINFPHNHCVSAMISVHNNKLIRKGCFLTNYLTNCFPDNNN